MTHLILVALSVATAATCPQLPHHLQQRIEIQVEHNEICFDYWSQDKNNYWRIRQNILYGNWTGKPYEFKNEIGYLFDREMILFSENRDQNIRSQIIHSAGITALISATILSAFLLFSNNPYYQTITIQK